MNLPVQLRQPSKVIEAYRVCETFEHVLGENLDFDRAYEATFTRSMPRRRAIAIAEGEFGDHDFAGIDDVTLIKAYKLRMQILYLMLPLANPSDEESGLFFPPEIKQILNRKAPDESGAFPAYVTQLGRDAALFRLHLNRLAAKHASVAERVNRFKEEALSATCKQQGTKEIEPQYGYLRSGVLGKNEAYYEIKGYIIARDDRRMRIVGIRFFTRLF